MINIIFGLELSDKFYPNVSAQTLAMGEQQFISFLETQTAIPLENTQEFLRVEQFRQLLALYLEQKKSAFFANSFAADSLATANAILSMRDELKLSFWDFANFTETPKRLKQFSEIENLLLKTPTLKLNLGFADRFLLIEKTLDLKTISLQSVTIIEPFELLPNHWQRLFLKLQLKGVQIKKYERQTNSNLEKSKLNDLQTLQAFVEQRIDKKQAANLVADGSVIIIKARHESEGCTWLAKLVNLNTKWKPLLLIPEQRKGLDIAMIYQGQPSMGLTTKSKARPTLQLLKLVSDFMFKPLNPYKLLEFLNLANKPLHEGISRKLADVVSKRPGIYSDVWVAVVATWFEKFDTKINNSVTNNKQLQLERDKAQEQYKFWFDRPRVDINNGKVATRTVIIIFDYIKDWAEEELSLRKAELKKTEEKLSSRKVKLTKANQLKLEREKRNLKQTVAHFQQLVEQTTQLAQILETVNEQQPRLSSLELERLVKYVAEPTATTYREAEKGCFDYVQQPSAVGEAEEVLWWDFVKVEQPPLFSRWYLQEFNYLQQNNWQIDNADLAQQRRLWQQKQPILAAQQRLILFIPDNIEGKEQEKHRLYADVESIWGDCKSITYNIENYFESEKYNFKGKENFETAENSNERSGERNDTVVNKNTNSEILNQWQLPNYELLTAIVWEEIEDSIEIEDGNKIELRPIESFSSLNELINKPHEWLLKYALELRKSPILSVVSKEALVGNLAHNIISDFLTEWKNKQTINENFNTENQQQEQQQELQTSSENKKLSPQTRQSVKEWLQEKEDKYIEKEGAILSMYGKEPERADFFNKLENSLWTLVRNIQVNGWAIRGAEQPLQGNFEGQQIAGRADLILERGEKDMALLDLKWKNSKYWIDALKNKDDWQLAIYAGMLAQEVGGNKEISTGYFSLLDAKAVSRDKRIFKEAQTAENSGDNGNVLEELVEKIIYTSQHRIKQMQSGKIIFNYEKETTEGGYEEMQKLLEPQNSSEKRSEEHTSELQSRQSISYAVFCL